MKCKKCGLKKPISHFSLRKKECKECEKERLKLYRQKIKRKVMYYYSNGKMKCKKCGFSDLRALSIDHINGGGCKHIKEIGGSQYFYPWLIKNKYPKGYQVLCFNCQWIKH